MYISIRKYESFIDSNSYNLLDINTKNWIEYLLINQANLHRDILLLVEDMRYKYWDSGSDPFEDRLLGKWKLKKKMIEV